MTTRRVPVIVALCALLLTVAFWYLLYQPRQQEAARYTEETAQLEGQRAQLQAEIAGLREIERNADDYRSQFERLAEYVPNSPAQPAALRSKACSTGLTRAARCAFAWRTARSMSFTRATCS